MMNIVGPLHKIASPTASQSMNFPANDAEPLYTSHNPSTASMLSSPRVASAVPSFASMITISDVENAIAATSPTTFENRRASHAARMTAVRAVHNPEKKRAANSFTPNTA